MLEVTGQPVQRLRLQAPPGFEFQAGQYLMVVHEAGMIPLSIGSGPWRLPEVHLYYRSTPGLPEAQWMDALLAAKDDLNVRGPFGNVTLTLPLDGPLIILCGGTGGAQALGMIDALCRQPPADPVGLLWCADDSSGLAPAKQLDGLEAPWLHAEFFMDPSRTADNRGMARLRALVPDFQALLGPDANPPNRIVLAGSPGFVYAATDLLTAAGVARSTLTSDVYDYAPRPSAGDD